MFPASICCALPLLAVRLAITFQVGRCDHGSEPFENFQLLYKSDWSSFVDRKIVFNRPLPKDFPKVSIVWNGLGVFSVGNRSVQHAFDGLARLVKVELPAAGHAPGGRTGRFTSQLLRSRQLNESLASNDIAPYLMFESVQPEYTKKQRIAALVNGLDNMNVNVAAVTEAGSKERKFIATNDYVRSYTFDLKNLATKERVEPKVNGRPLGMLSQISSAHPLPEFGTGCLINFVTTVAPVPFANGALRLVRYRTAGSAETVAAWPVRGDRLPYMHSFALTRGYAVVFAAPLYVDPLRMVQTAQPFLSLRWQPELPTDVFLVHLATGKRRQLRVSDGRFLMHHLNAFETADGRIVVYATAYADTLFFTGLELRIINDDYLRDKIPINSELRRYTIDLTQGTVISEVAQSGAALPHLVNLEMPVINEAWRYLANCYTFGIVMKSDSVHLANISLARRNLCGRQDLEDAVWYQQHHYPCEPQFVARQHPDAEDDGYLVTLVLDGLKARTYVAVFDARSLSLLTRAWLPVALPYRLHGKVFFE